MKTINDKYKSLLLEVKGFFADSSYSIHKARNEIKIVEYEEQEYVVKSFKVPNIINKIAYAFFRDSKAKKSFEYALKIKNFTPTPIGYIEFFKYGLLENSYFVSERFEYDFTIREPLLDNNFENRQEILESFSTFAFELHENGIFHNDFSPGNILIKKEKTKYIIKIVDINRMTFVELSTEMRMKNFAQLWSNDEDLKIIINKYSKMYEKDVTILYKLAQNYSQQHKNKKNMKKRLKGKKVVD